MTVNNTDEDYGQSFSNRLIEAYLFAGFKLDELGVPYATPELKEWEKSFKFLVLIPHIVVVKKIWEKGDGSFGKYLELYKLHTGAF